MEGGRFRQGVRSTPQGLALTGSAARLHALPLAGRMLSAANGAERSWLLPDSAHYKSTARKQGTPEGGSLRRGPSPASRSPRSGRSGAEPTAFFASDASKERRRGPLCDAATNYHRVAMTPPPPTVCYAYSVLSAVKGAVGSPELVGSASMASAATYRAKERRHPDSWAREGPQQERHVWIVHHISCGGYLLSLRWWWSMRFSWRQNTRWSACAALGWKP
jgi:hypothetical protein